MSNSLQMNNFIAINDDGEGVLGKILYYSLSSVLIEKINLTEICAEIYKVYCRDNVSGQGVISRELVKETLGATTNDYKKLANITFSKESGMIYYDDLAYDEHVDALDYCREAVELFEL